MNQLTFSFDVSVDVLYKIIGGQIPGMCTFSSSLVSSQYSARVTLNISFT